MECEHIIDLEPVPPRTPGCEECLKLGMRPGFISASA